MQLVQEQAVTIPEVARRLAKCESVLATFLMLCITGLATLAYAEDEARVKPIDFYVSGFGGYSFPFKTDLSFQGATVISALELDKSPSFGGKVGVWFTTSRKTLGINIGTEIDVTNFNPDTAGILQLNATSFCVNILARVPMGMTPELPNGRWFPYIGVGGGAQRLTFETPETTGGRNTAPAFQGLWGVEVFLFKHLAVFGEGKFTHASHTLTFQSGLSTAEFALTVNALHGVAGLSVHF